MRGDYDTAIKQLQKAAALDPEEKVGREGGRERSGGRKEGWEGGREVEGRGRGGEGRAE